MAKFKTTHILTIGEHQIVGEGSENAKEGRIELRLHPAIVLSWEDDLYIRLTPVVGRTKTRRNEK